MIKSKYFKVVIISIIIFFVIIGIYFSNNKKEEIKIKNTNLLQSELSSLEKERNDPYLLLVNKNNLLKENYVAKDISESKLPFLPYIVTTKLNKTAIKNAKKMFEDAKSQGIYLLGASGYRTHKTQVTLFNSNVKRKGKKATLEYSAPPGASEHETGLAIDILSKDSTNLDDRFEKSKAFKWLKNNCYKYGFILRYPKDKVNITKYCYEPWHYRYVGKKHAEKIMKNNLCLEEYLNNLDKDIENLKDKLNSQK